MTKIVIGGGVLKTKSGKWRAFTKRVNRTVRTYVIKKYEVSLIEDGRVQSTRVVNTAGQAKEIKRRWLAGKSLFEISFGL